MRATLLLLSVAASLLAQDFQRPRPSRPIPPPSAVVSYTILIPRGDFPQAIHVMGTWQVPDGETSVYRHNEFIPSSWLGPGDHVTTEVDVPALVDLVPVDQPDCAGGCGPYCAQTFEITTGRHACNCTLFPFVVAVPMRTSNAAEQFIVANQTRRLVVFIRDRETGTQLGAAMVRDLTFGWADIGVYAAPTQKRRAAR